MKRKIFVLVLTLALILSLSPSAWAATPSDEEARHFGADTITLAEWRPLDGTKITNRAQFEQETGLTVFEDVQAFSIWGGGQNGGFAISNTYYGLKNQAGAVVLPAEFLSLEYIGNERIVGNRVDKTRKDSYGVWMELGYGVYDLTGRELFPASASSIEYANNAHDMFLISLQGKSGLGLYDLAFRQLVAPEYLTISSMENGYGDGADYYLLHKGEMRDSSVHSYGVYRVGKGIIIPCNPQYTGISYLGSDMFRVRLSAFQYIAIDGEGKQINSVPYAGIHSYYNGYFAVAIPRSESAFQSALQKNSPSSAYNSGAGDFAKEEAYLTMGIVDKAGNLYSSFDHEQARIDRSGLVTLGAWNGGYREIIVNSGTNYASKSTTKDYDEDTLLVSQLTATGETVADLFQSRDLSTYTANLVVCGFNDVKGSAYYADAVVWAVDKGVTTGTSTTTFSPDTTCTTAQILTFLWRANGSPAPAGSNAVVPAGQYYSNAANWALEKGLIDTFNADTPATRAATMTYLWKLAGKPAADAASFTDVTAGAEYAQAVAWAVKEGITSGTSSTTFSPDNICTRAQIMTFLYRDFAK